MANPEIAPGHGRRILQAADRAAVDIARKINPTFDMHYRDRYGHASKVETTLMLIDVFHKFDLLYKQGRFPEASVVSTHEVFPIDEGVSNSRWTVSDKETGATLGVMEEFKDAEPGEIMHKLTLHGPDSRVIVAADKNDNRQVVFQNGVGVARISSTEILDHTSTQRLDKIKTGISGIKSHILGKLTQQERAVNES